MLMLSISATARALSVPLSHVHQWLDENRLQLKAVNHMKRIPVSSIQALIETFPDTVRKVAPHDRGI
jgi:hypothetical protein